MNSRIFRRPFSPDTMWIRLLAIPALLANSLIREMLAAPSTGGEERQTTRVLSCQPSTLSRDALGLTYIAEFLDRLLGLSTTDIRFRCIVASCAALGSPVFRLRLNVEVEGQEFWERFSRVRSKNLSALERECSQSDNTVLILGPPLADAIAERKPGLHNRRWTGQIETNIGGLIRRTKAELWVF